MRVFEGGGMPVCFQSKQAFSTPDTALGRIGFTDSVGCKNPNFATTGCLAGMYLCVLGCRLENEMKFEKTSQESRRIIWLA
jgi:hypothetical protein